MASAVADADDVTSRALARAPKRIKVVLMASFKRTIAALALHIRL